MHGTSVGVGKGKCAAGGSQQTNKWLATLCGCGAVAATAAAAPLLSLSERGDEKHSRNNAITAAQDGSPPSSSIACLSKQALHSIQSSGPIDLEPQRRSSKTSPRLTPPPIIPPSNHHRARSSKRRPLLLLSQTGSDTRLAWRYVFVRVHLCEAQQRVCVVRARPALASASASSSAATVMMRTPLLLLLLLLLGLAHAFVAPSPSQQQQQQQQQQWRPEQRRVAAAEAGARGRIPAGALASASMGMRSVVGWPSYRSIRKGEQGRLTPSYFNDSTHHPTARGRRMGQQRRQEKGRGQQRRQEHRRRRTKSSLKR